MYSGERVRIPMKLLAVGQNGPRPVQLNPLVLHTKDHLKMKKNGPLWHSIKQKQQQTLQFRFCHKIVKLKSLDSICYFRYPIVYFYLYFISFSMIFIEGERERERDGVGVITVFSDLNTTITQRVLRAVCDTQ